MSGRIPSERSFGLSVGAASIVFSGLLVWRAHPRAALVLAPIGALLLLGGLLAPAALRVPNRIWWRFASLLGWINSRVLLTVFFYLVLTPAGILMRAFGHNPLRAAGGATNWSAYNERRRDAKHYEHLF